MVNRSLLQSKLAPNSSSSLSILLSISQLPTQTCISIKIMSCYNCLSTTTYCKMLLMMNTKYTMIPHNYLNSSSEGVA